MNDFWVYILASRTRVLYIGVTSDPQRRIYEHKHRLLGGFTAKYLVNRLVHIEGPCSLMDARRREHQLKGWKRFKKLALIEAGNPEWKELEAGRGSRMGSSFRGH